MYGKKYVRKAGKAVKKMVRKAPVKKVVSKAVKAYVSRIVHKNVENKVAYASGTDVSIIPMAQSVPLLAASIIPLSSVWILSQGTGQSNRIGTSITPLKWDMSLYLHNNGANNIPCLVRMIVFKNKTFTTTPFGTNLQPLDILQTGNFTSPGTGNYFDLKREINKDNYTVYYDKVMKIGGAVAGTTANSNNDFNCVRFVKVNLLKFQKHAIKYADAVTSPTNSGLYVSFFFAPYDGSTILAADITAGKYPQMSFDIDAKYEDA